MIGAIRPELECEFYNRETLQALQRFLIQMKVTYILCGPSCRPFNSVSDEAMADAPDLVKFMCDFIKCGAYCAKNELDFGKLSPLARGYLQGVVGWMIANLSLSSRSDFCSPSGS